MIRFIWIFFLLLLSSWAAFTQNTSSFQEDERELETLLNDLRKAENNSDKRDRNKLFKAKLEETLKKEGSMSYPFSRLTTVGFISSPDQLIRIVNWNVEQDDFTQNYYCYIQRFDEKKNERQLIELTKSMDVMALRPKDILASNQWYGALYYQIIPFEKGNKDMYTLLGWDGLGTTSNMKILDVLYFSGNQAKLGSPVFKVGNETLKRVFYEHSEKATMSLRFDGKYNRILMDHLSPESPNLVGHYSYYVPDLSYDAFILKSGKWYLQEDVIAINDKTAEKIEIAVMNDEGQMELDSLGNPENKKRIKNKWINPSDPNSPGGGNNHEAALPDEVEETPDKKENKEPIEQKRKWYQKKDKRDPNNPYPFDPKNKIRKKKKK